MKIYIEKMDNGNGYVGYYQDTTIYQLKKYIKKRGLLKLFGKLENEVEYREITLKEINELN